MKYLPEMESKNGKHFTLRRISTNVSVPMSSFSTIVRHINMITWFRSQHYRVVII